MIDIGEKTECLSLHCLLEVAHEFLSIADRSNVGSERMANRWE
jgi:hypothetical protein